MSTWTVRILAVAVAVLAGVVIWILLTWEKPKETVVVEERTITDAPIAEAHRDAVNKALDGLASMEKEIRSRRDEVNKEVENLVRDGAADIDALLRVLRGDKEKRGAGAADGADGTVR